MYTVVCWDNVEWSWRKNSKFAEQFIKGIDTDWKKIITADGLEAIIREIEFPPEYIHAGITILSNFSSLIRDKYKNEEIKVSIQQEGAKVTLIIEGEGGVRERIEETLYEYGLVLSGQEPIEILTDDPYKIAELKQQLRIAQIQLENQKELLEIEKRHNLQIENKNTSIESQYKEMIKIISNSLSDKGEENSFLRTLITAANSTQSETAKSSLNALIGIIENQTQNENKKVVVESLQSIRQNDPGAFKQITDFAKSCTSSMVGSALYSWIIPIINSLPKWIQLKVEWQIAEQTH